MVVGAWSMAGVLRQLLEYYYYYSAAINIATTQQWAISVIAQDVAG